MRFATMLVILAVATTSACPFLFPQPFDGQGFEGEGEGEGEFFEAFCPFEFDQAIIDCVDDLEADPEIARFSFLIDLVLACADAEPLADEFDAYCATTFDANLICQEGLESLMNGPIEQCRARVLPVIFDGRCALPNLASDIATSRSFAFVEQHEISLDDGLITDLERAQVETLGARIGLPGLTAEQVLAEFGVRGALHETYREVAFGRTIVTIRIPTLGGERETAISFFAGTTFVVGVHGEFILECAIERGSLGSACVAPAGCTDGEFCAGVLVEDESVFDGSCAPLDAVEGEGVTCAQQSECPGNLLCMPASTDGSTGVCLPSWQRRAYRLPDLGAFGDNGDTADVLLPVSGTAPVLLSARVTATIEVPVGAGAVSLTTPSGTTVLIGTFDQRVRLVRAPISVSGEQAGGVWTVSVAMLERNSTVTVTGFVLELDTRFE